MLRAHSIEIIGQVIAVLVLGFPIRPQAEEVDTIEANIEAAELAAEAEADDWFQDIRRRRSGLREWLGLESAATYHSVALGSVPGEELAGAGGDFTLQGIWTPSHHWTENPLALHFRFRHRHAYGELAPSELGSENGALWGFIDGFSDKGFEVPDFYLQHRFPRNGVILRYGQMTIDGFFDMHALRSSKQAFMNQAFSSNPAVAFPRFGAGTVVEKAFGNGWDIALGASTVQASKQGSQVDFDLASGEIFTAIQAGHDLGGDSCRSRIQVMAWHSDAVENTGSPEGRGISLTFERGITESDPHWFSRFAWAHGGAAESELLAAGGVAWQVYKSLLGGVSLGIGQGHQSGSPVQSVIETFVRWEPRPGIRISPDLQCLIGDELNGSPGYRLIGGLRIGIDF